MNTEDFIAVGRENSRNFSVLDWAFSWQEPAPDRRSTANRTLGSCEKITNRRRNRLRHQSRCIVFNGGAGGSASMRVSESFFHSFSRSRLGK
jgi:hypothetical protein